jgi:hypothetical protein
MSAGYIYVLVNSSMPGLVKVGKTARHPTERAEELSGVTGVATPFIVAFEQYFEDCDAAEAFVHTKLAEKKLRVSDSREFFRASTSEVVKVIVSIGASTSSRTSPVNDDDLLTADNDEFAGFNTSGRKPPEPWEALLEEADKHHLGLEGYLQDDAEAMKLYRDAARLGSAKAYERIGNIYYYRHGNLQDNNTALEYYKEGAKKGNYFCYARMAQLFMEQGHRDNARKAFARFVSEGGNAQWLKYRDFQDYHIHQMYLVCIYSIRHLSEIDSELMQNMARYSDQIVGYAENLLCKERTCDSPSPAVLTTIYGVIDAMRPIVKGQGAGS